MSTDNERNRNKMSLFVQGHSDEMDRLNKETERAIVNTRQFLDQLGRSQERSKEYIKQYKASLESKLERLRDKRGNS